MAPGRLEVSHPALYFPPPPEPNSFVENSVRLTFEAESAVHSQQVAIVFKLKCSAPNKFHVLPRIGAMVLPAGESSANIVITVAVKDDSCLSVNGARSPCASLMNRSTLTATPRNGKGGFRDYQERFSIDVIYITASTEVAHIVQRLKNAPTLKKHPNDLSDVFEKASTGTLGANAIPLSPVHLKVFMDQVVMGKKGDQLEPGCVVVPAEADVRIVPMRSSRQHSTATPVQMPTIGGGSALSIAEETQRLKAELQRLEQAIADTERDKIVLERGVAGSAAILNKYELQQQTADDTNRQLPVKRKRGIPFVVVLFLMFVTFAVTLFFRLQDGRVITNPFGLRQYATSGGDEM